MQKTWVRILTTVMTLAVMAMIFFFSTEQAAESDATSGMISLQVIRWTHPEYDTLPAPEKKVLYDSVQTVIRKIAHFTEFALLGFSLRLCLESWFGAGNRRLGLPAWLGGVGYAALDELHQTWVDGRSGQLTDVLIDSSGAAAGVLLGFLLVNHLLKKNRTSGKNG